MTAAGPPPPRQPSLAPPLPPGERQGRDVPARFPAAADGSGAGARRGRRHRTAVSRRAMEQPRLITDSFPLRRRPGRAPGRVKGRVKGRGHPRVRPRAPPPTEDSPPPPALDQELLEMLRRFDLAWEYGPCTGETPPGPLLVPPMSPPIPAPLTVTLPQVSPACSGGSGRRRWG